MVGRGGGEPTGWWWWRKVADAGWCSGAEGLDRTGSVWLVRRKCGDLMVVDVLCDEKAVLCSGKSEMVGFQEGAALQLSGNASMSGVDS